MSIKSRLRRLERQAGPQGGRCPDCPPIALVEEDEAGNLVSGKYPEPCSSCGGPDGEICSIVVVRPSAAVGDCPVAGGDC
jgi:hypothetical protein